MKRVYRIFPALLAALLIFTACKSEPETSSSEEFSLPDMTEPTIVSLDIESLLTAEAVSYTHLWKCQKTKRGGPLAVPFADIHTGSGDQPLDFILHFSAKGTAKGPPLFVFWHFHAPCRRIGRFNDD